MAEVFSSARAVATQNGCLEGENARIKTVYSENTVRYYPEKAFRRNKIKKIWNAKKSKSSGMLSLVKGETGIPTFRKIAVLSSVGSRTPLLDPEDHRYYDKSTVHYFTLKMKALPFFVTFVPT
jgi:hypothetical protein